MKKSKFIFILLIFLSFTYAIKAQINVTQNPPPTWDPELNFQFINLLDGGVTCDVSIIPVSLIFNGDHANGSGEYSLYAKWPLNDVNGSPYVRYDSIASFCEMFLS